MSHTAWRTPLLNTKIVTTSLIITMFLLPLISQTCIADETLEIGKIQGENKLRYILVGPVLTYEIINKGDTPVSNINCTIQVEHLTFDIIQFLPFNFTISEIPAHDTYANGIQFSHFWGKFSFTLTIMVDDISSVSKTAFGFVLGRFFICVTHTT